MRNCRKRAKYYLILIIFVIFLLRPFLFFSLIYFPFLSRAHLNLKKGSHHKVESYLFILFQKDKIKVKLIWRKKAKSHHEVESYLAVECLANPVAVSQAGDSDASVFQPIVIVLSSGVARVFSWQKHKTKPGDSLRVFQAKVFLSSQWVFRWLWLSASLGRNTKHIPTLVIKSGENRYCPLQLAHSLQNTQKRPIPAQWVSWVFRWLWLSASLGKPQKQSNLRQVMFCFSLQTHSSDIRHQFTYIQKQTKTFRL